MRKLESSGKQMAHKEPGRFSAKSCRSLKKSAVSPWYGDIDYELEYKDALAFLEVD